MEVAPKGELEKVFGGVLRTLRVKHGLSQEALAFESSLDRTFISMLERGQRLPSIATLRAVAKPLGLSGSELMALVEADLPAA